MVTAKVRRAAGKPSAAVESESGGLGREVLLKAALDTFVQKGFHGTSMRDIAARAGASISATYYYYPSKADLLKTIMRGVTEDLIAMMEAARDAAGPRPEDRFAAIVRAHVRLHTERQPEAFIGNSELRSLDPGDRAEMVALRDRAGGVLKDVLAEGLRIGTFTCPYPGEAALAILTMCTAVASWFRPGGRSTPAEVADRYAGLALAMVGFVPRG